ncbi:MAG: hypothetical protein QGH25_04410 [Candidatus Latescibacteria bacterium]|nr:hypothetical protein [Candidatus Latescibacterota bacterium]
MGTYQGSQANMSTLHACAQRVRAGESVVGPLGRQLRAECWRSI